MVFFRLFFLHPRLLSAFLMLALSGLIFSFNSAAFAEVIVVTPHQSRIMNAETRHVFENMDVNQRAQLLTIASALQEQIDRMPLSKRVALIHFIKENNENIDPTIADYQSLEPFVRRLATELSRALQESTEHENYFETYYNSFDAFLEKQKTKDKKSSLQEYSKARIEQEKLRTMGRRRAYLDTLLQQERQRYADPKNVGLRDTIQPVIDTIQAQITLIDNQLDEMLKEN